MSAIETPVVQRFVRYVTYDTASILRKPGTEEKDKKVPSSNSQRDFNIMLREEIVEMGLANIATLLDNGSLLVHLPATEGYDDTPRICYSAHVDTYPGQPGKANPQIHLYNGGDIELLHDNVVIPASDLAGLEGKHIITADGSSLLGGDDKCGVASLITVIDTITKLNVPHGELYFWFCVDEEIGEVAPDALPKGLAESLHGMITVDGGRLGHVDVGCFIGRMVQVTFTGNDSHPGEQPDKLKPAHYAATKFASMLLDKPAPMNTRERESFWYYVNIEGNASKATVVCIPRTFDANESEAMGEELERLAREAGNFYKVSVVCNNVLQYHSTEKAINEHAEILGAIISAHLEHGIPVKEGYIRGGTDGAMINVHYPNLPAPNIGAGGVNFHGRQEFVVAEELALLPQILMSTIEFFSLMRGQPR